MRKILFAILVLVVIAIGLLHFLTPGYLIFYHDMYRRLSYFPIVLGAIWFGVWGGLALAVMSSIAFIPHVLLYIGQETGTYLSELTEIIACLIALQDRKQHARRGRHLFCNRLIVAGDEFRRPGCAA